MPLVVPVEFWTSYDLISMVYKGGLHEKTRTGASFIPGWLFDFVSHLHDNWVISFEGTLHVNEIYVWFKIANITHALPIPVHRQTDFTPKRVVVLRLHDTIARFRTGVKFSPWYNNRGELTLGWLTPAWWYHVNKCRALRGNRSDLASGKSRPGVM